MSGILPSFLSGSQLVIRIGQLQIAYCQALSFSHNMSVAPVGGIGSYNFFAIEPLQYAAQGSLVITRYDSASLASAKKSSVLTGSSSGATNSNAKAAPENLLTTNNGLNQDGNSMLDGVAFNPAKLIISQTFDIDVYQRSVDAKGVGAAATGSLAYTIYDCRLTDYSFGFSPGQLLQESVSFLCRGVMDRTLSTSDKNIDLSEKLKLQLPDNA